MCFRDLVYVSYYTKDTFAAGQKLSPPTKELPAARARLCRWSRCFDCTAVAVYSACFVKPALYSNSRAWKALTPESPKPKPSEFYDRLQYCFYCLPLLLRTLPLLRRRRPRHYTTTVATSPDASTSKGQYLGKAVS